MVALDFADRVQPVVDEAAALAVDRRGDAAAAVMADDHDVLDLQHVDGELQDREVVGVLRRGEVGDVAVHEQLAGIEPDDFVGRHAAVGAADPEIFGRLLAFQAAEEAGVGRRPCARPRRGCSLSDDRAWRCLGGAAGRCKIVPTTERSRMPSPLTDIAAFLSKTGRADGGVLAAAAGRVGAAGLAAACAAQRAASGDCAAADDDGGDVVGAVAVEDPAGFRRAGLLDAADGGACLDFAARSLVADVVLPRIAVFGPIVDGVEALIGVSLLLARTGAGGAGAAMAPIHGWGCIRRRGNGRGPMGF